MRCVRVCVFVAVVDSLSGHPAGNGHGEGIPSAPAHRGAKGKRSGESAVVFNILPALLLDVYSFIGRVSYTW